MPPEVHLPETVLGMDVALGKEQVVMGGCVDLGNPIGVPVDLDLSIQARQLDISINHGEGFFRFIFDDGWS